MRNQRLFYLSKGCALMLHNIFGFKKKRTDSFIKNEYTDQISDWVNYKSSATSLGVKENKFEYLTNEEKCGAYLNLISQEIKEYRTVLDAGCGGGVNINVLKERYPEKSIVGFDVLEPRVRSAREIAKQKETDIRFFRGDIRKIGLKDKSVEATYTSLVLEQLPAHTLEALNELIRVTRHKIIVIEPCYEYGNFAQKQYLTYKDYTRSLKKDIEMLELQGKIRIRKAAKLNSIHNPLNPAGIFVLDTSL